MSAPSDDSAGLADTQGEAILPRQAGRVHRALMWTRRRPALAALLLVSGLAVVALLAAGVCLYLTGCAESKINKANFDKVTTGMSEKEVETILGKAHKQSNLPDMPKMGNNELPVFTSGTGVVGKVKIWKDGSKMINITFKDGKVMEKIATGL